MSRESAVHHRTATDPKPGRGVPIPEFLTCLVAPMVEAKGMGAFFDVQKGVKIKPRYGRYLRLKFGNVSIKQCK